MSEKFFGKYRGIVVLNTDPESRGRIQAQVPAVTGIALTSWALPCFPSAGIQSGFFTVPPVGAGVWIEFEGGNIDAPIWSGCFYATGLEVPAVAVPAVPPAMGCFVLQTQNQTTLMVSDAPGPAGGVLLKTALGAAISISDVGITITNGQGAIISLIGPTVSINGTALTIT